MKNYPYMEEIDSDIEQKTLEAAEGFDPKGFAASDVSAALEKDTLAPRDFAALLSDAAKDMLEPLAARAKRETYRHFGNSVALFTPLYISNHCENGCLYCGFNCKNKISRAKLTLDETEREMASLAASGLSEILILTGESRVKSPVSYIGEAVMLAARFFSTVGIEIYPLNTGEYAFLKEKGADFVSVYQETYDREIYRENHPSGPKSVYSYRFNSQERALAGGMRGVSFGVLLGLGDYRRDAFSAGMHAFFLQREKFPHAEISFSVPRIKGYINAAGKNSGSVGERELLQVMLAYRLFMPFAPITISTRESPRFRDNVVGLCATKISAGVSVGVGGREVAQKGDGQFMISDERSVYDIHLMLKSRGLQPVYSNYIRV